MVDFERSAVDSPAVRKSSAVELDRTGAEQCGTPSNRAPPSNWETPSYLVRAERVREAFATKDASFLQRRHVYCTGLFSGAVGTIIKLAKKGEKEAESCR